MTKKLILASLFGATMFASAGIVAYQATALNTPQTGYLGEIVAIQACSTNATGTATVSSVTDLSVGGSPVSFTNELVSVTLTGGVASAVTNGVYVAPRQRVIVSGSAFPGGSVILWLEDGK